MFPRVISAACWFPAVRLPSHIPSLTSSWFSVYHLVWQWLLTLLCTVAVKMQISQDSAFLFCRQFTVWRPHLPAAEQRTRVSAISILLSLGKMPQYLFTQTAALLSHCKAAEETNKQPALGSLMFEALTLFALVLYVFKVVGSWRETLSWAVSSCRQIAEIASDSVPLKLWGGDFKPHFTQRIK